MNKFDQLSIADLKASIDYVNKLKNERLEDLKSTDINSKHDIAFQSLDKLAFDLHNNLFSRLMKLTKN